eukprot:TRINITY_DN851_c0_g1_i1.p1 TRINITY_DN851_c0_g1~~TRINITY_DN851_c0_g1_i1.p1  ORF type:complete len:323 (-),score=51.14 TRINITY_DN851_c0_g1_i1:9-977(-)
MGACASGGHISRGGKFGSHDGPDAPRERVGGSGLRVHGQNVHNDFTFGGHQVLTSPSKQIPRELTYSESLEIGGESFADRRMQDEAFLQNIISHAAREFIDISSHIPAMPHIMAEREAMYTTIREKTIADELLPKGTTHISISCIALPCTETDEGVDRQKRAKQLQYSQQSQTSTTSVSEVVDILKSQNYVETRAARGKKEQASEREGPGQGGKSKQHSSKNNKSKPKRRLREEVVMDMSDDSPAVLRHQCGGESDPRFNRPTAVDSESESESETEHGQINVKRHAARLGHAVDRMSIVDQGQFVIQFDDSAYSVQTTTIHY